MSDDVVVDLYDEDLDPADVERLTLALRRELLDLDEVERVTPAETGPAPPGSRAVGLIEIGSLLVAIKPTVEAVARVVGVLRDWLGARAAAKAPHRTMRITLNGQTLELTPTQTEQTDLVDAFVRAAVAAGDDAPGAPTAAAPSPAAGSAAGSAAAPGEGGPGAP